MRLRLESGCAADKKQQAVSDEKRQQASALQGLKILCFSRTVALTWEEEIARRIKRFDSAKTETIAANEAFDRLRKAAPSQ